MLAGEPAPDGQPRRVYTAPGDRGVRPGQVDVLEQTSLRVGGRESPRPDARLVDPEPIARLHLAHERRAPDLPRCPLAFDNPAAGPPARHKQPATPRTPRRRHR